MNSVVLLMLEGHVFQPKRSADAPSIGNFALQAGPPSRAFGTEFVTHLTSDAPTLNPVLLQ
jgi:hypothetical protein